MKIECAGKEKKLLIDMFMESGTCPFDSAHCSEWNVCRECFEKNVEWQIKDGEQE